MPRNTFQSMPIIPPTGNDPMDRALETMRENIEMLCGMRSKNDTAVTRADITVAYPAELTGTAATDIANLRETLRFLLVNLKG